MECISAYCSNTFRNIYCIRKFVTIVECVSSDTGDSSRNIGSSKFRTATECILTNTSYILRDINACNNGIISKCTISNSYDRYIIDCRQDLDISCVLIIQSLYRICSTFAVRSVSNTIRHNHSTIRAYYCIL